MNQLVMDITELVANPIRTGIQRVVRELIRYWPNPSHLTLARFDPSCGLVSLPDSLLPLLLDDDDRTKQADPQNLKRYLDEAIENSVTGTVPSDCFVLVPELFFDPARASWYRNRLRQHPHSAFFIVYDFIPWLYPERVLVASTAPHMSYLRLVREASFTAFISGRTRTDYISRIRRCASTDVGPVLPLGADGLSFGRQTFDTKKHAYVAVGAINGNKNQDRVFAAFRELWRQGFDGSLVLIGRVYDRCAEGWLQEARREPNFRHLVDASDADVCAELRNARATIFVSEVEGFGLPPVESLYSGIPVIVTAGTPSIAELPPDGQIRLVSAEVPAIMAAVRSVADDETAARLWQGAASLKLPTWRELAHRTAAWVNAFPRQSVAPTPTNEEISHVSAK